MVSQLQVYISTCILFVTAALFEYCSIIAMLRFPVNHNEEDPEGAQAKEEEKTKNRLSRGIYIDMCSMITLTILFICFNVNYFDIVNRQ